MDCFPRPMQRTGRFYGRYRGQADLAALMVNF